MILGRTPEGLIKTKSDGALGLRAVNCACCGCGCNGVAIPENLRSLFEDATIDSITMWGYAPEDFFPLGPAEGYPEGSWGADWFVTDVGFLIVAGLVYVPNGCLYASQYMEYQDQDAGYNASVAFGKIDECITPGLTGVAGTFTINGAGEFPWYYLTQEFYTSSPPPNIVVS